MEKIIVFTSIGSLDSKFASFAERNDVKLIENHELLYYNLESYTFEVTTDFKNGGIYFVRHDIKRTKFNNLLEIHKFNTFILKHQAPKFTFSGFTIVRNGQHEPYCPYYSNIVNILSDSEGEKIQRIIKVFKYDDVLEKKQELINKIWNGEIPDLLPDPDGKWNAINSALSNLKAAIGNKEAINILSAEYRAAFQDFKKALKLEE